MQLMKAPKNPDGSMEFQLEVRCESPAPSFVDNNGRSQSGRLHYGLRFAPIPLSIALPFDTQHIHRTVVVFVAVSEEVILIQQRSEPIFRPPAAKQLSAHSPGEPNQRKQEAQTGKEINCIQSDDTRRVNRALQRDSFHERFSPETQARTGRERSRRG